MVEFTVKRVVLLLLGILLFVGGSLLSLCPIPKVSQADSPTIIMETLPDGTVRVNPYTTETILGSSGVLTTYQEDISLLPQTLSDLKTKIVCEWLSSTDIDGVTTFSTGSNTYSASVVGTTVTVQYEGRECIWNPTIATGSNNFTLYYGPVVVPDPFNTNYPGNTVEWKYHCYVGGFLGIGTRTVTVIRYLRQIEGSLVECYVLDSDPGSGFTVYQGYSQEPGFPGQFTVGAWDYNKKSIPVSYNQIGKYVTEESLKAAKYPVTVDPTFTTYGTASDCYAGYSGDTGGWNLIHSLPSSSYSYSSTTSQVICDNDGSGWYQLDRAFLYFDTSSLTGDTVTSASLNLYIDGASSYDSTTLNVNQDGTTYPEVPYQPSDYYYAHYLNLISSVSIGLLPQSGYYGITLSPSSIMVGGSTKFMLDTGNDIGGSGPSSSTEVFFYDYQKGSGYQPKLIVTYTTPSTVPTVSTGSSTSQTDTSFAMAGTLTDTGGSTPCNIWFDYGITSSYGNTVSLSPMYATGAFSGTATANIQPGTIYHWRSDASNSVGSANPPGSDSTVLTKPSGPTHFVVTPGNTNNTLNWTIGTGATLTTVMWKTTGYPQNIADGTLLVLSNGSSYVHTGLTNGKVYYYTMWSYAYKGGLGQYSVGSQQATGTPTYTGAPNVSTYSATSVTQSTAIFNGQINSLQGSTSANCWFQYYSGGGTWTDNPAIYPSPYTFTSAPQKFSSPTVSGLSINTIYHVRAVSQNIYGTAYGVDMPFTTNGSCAPTVQTTYASVSYNSATLNGLIVSDGLDPSGVTVWFEYGPTTTYGYNSSMVGGWFTGSVPSLTLTSFDVPNFVSGSTWHYQLVGKNIRGTNLGGDVNFTLSSPNAPVCNTSPAINVGSSGATLRGTVMSDGGAVGAVSVGFFWGTSIPYDNWTGWQTGFSVGQPFSYTVSGLQLFTIYHYMATVQNAGGTGNGTDSQFMTQFAAPGSFTAVASSPTTIILSWVTMGDDTGIWMSTGGFPLDRLQTPYTYFGSGSSISLTSLTPGTTYFFRAWTFSNSYSWSPTYSEDAVTTPGQQSSVVVSGTNISVNLTQPPEYFQSPNGSNLSHWPGYALVQQASAGTGIPEGTLWLIIVLTISSACGLIAWGISGSLGFVIVTVCVVMGVASIMHLLSMWILFAFILLGGSLAMVLRHNA